MYNVPEESIEQENDSKICDMCRYSLIVYTGASKVCLCGLYVGVHRPPNIQFQYTSRHDACATWFKRWLCSALEYVEVAREREACPVFKPSGGRTDDPTRYRREPNVVFGSPDVASWFYWPPEE